MPSSTDAGRRLPIATSWLWCASKRSLGLVGLPCCRATGRTRSCSKYRPACHESSCSRPASSSDHPRQARFDREQGKFVLVAADIELRYLVDS